MNNLPKVADLTVFILVVKNNSFVKAADELGTSPAYISKRIQILEQTLNCKLLHRSTRSLSLTDDGEVIYEWASHILLNLKDMTETVASHSGNPIGTLSITSSLGFGRRHVAPLLSDFISLYPKLKIRFDAVDKVQDLITNRIDLDIRIGNDIAPHLIAKKLHPNRRILCAAPDYLARHGTPTVLKDLLQHECLVIKERDHPFGLWELNSAQGGQDIKVSGTLASNNGEMVRLWALAGHGIMLRSVWDIGPEIDQGTLVQVLPDYWQDADIWAVYPSRLNASAKLRVCVEFFERYLPQRLYGTPEP
ncbi:MAG: LysR family transcriptional regulator [Neisseriaceae bacterium]|nr:LysR family transcriptional regulator [Neisseriaceae bacterium]